ncbi:hypothetical protein ZIOFF_058960 [Zingiber officinale]|uniref:Uncharacterized protein n=1 Tax=Zingiber officinale TaxID=94328 RepID=A0A8J5KJ79_ZINOF|nr:hypothetical protein ZIOFF_058960 [Zingiber officinale]
MKVLSVVFRLPTLTAYPRLPPLRIFPGIASYRDQQRCLIAWSEASSPSNVRTIFAAYDRSKHAVKCTRSRIEAIWKKKQAMVRFLKKDVADLIAAGHESNAFERMDALICEINHASCYEMIKQFGEVVLNQLPSLQKLRKCPQGAVEAVSTLIFAAARFSDLPELCDLRRIFTNRYGGPMESFVNAEFVEKIQKKTFSKEDKLQMMQNIAEEFSVRWDSWAFEHKPSNSPPRKYEQPKKVVPLHSVNNATRIMSTEGTKVQSLPRKKCKLKATTIEQWHRQTDSKDNHMISTVSPSNAPCEKARKAEAIEIENVKPYLDDGVMPLYDNKISNQTDGNNETKGVWYNKTAKVLEKLDPIAPEKEGVYLMKPLNEKQVIPPYAKSNWSNNYLQVEEKIRNGSQYDSSQRYAEMVYPGEKKRQPASLVPPYVKPFNDVKAIQKLDSTCPTKPYVISDDRKDEILGNPASTGNSLQRKLQKLTVSEANDSVLTEIIDRAFYDEKNRSRTPRDRRRYTRRQSASSINDYYDNGKTIKRYHGEPIEGEVDTRKGDQGRHIAGANADYYHDRKTSGRHPREPIDDEMDNPRRHASWKSGGCIEEYYDVGNTVDRHPTVLIDNELDTRRRRHRSRHSSGNDCDYYDDGKTRIRLPREHIVGEKDSRRHSSWKSVGHKVEYYEESHTSNRHGNEPIHQELDNRRQHRGKKNEDDICVYYDKGKITTRYAREPSEGRMDNQRRRTGWRSAGTISEFYGQMDTSVDHCKRAERTRTPTPTKSRRNKDWQDAARCDEYDNDEMVMDRLLIHYSRKGTPRGCTHKTWTNRNPLRDHVLDSDRPRASAPPLDRTTSTPPEPVGQSEVVSKVSARVESMQGNMLSSNGIRVHPRLPEYDELVARFASF